MGATTPSEARLTSSKAYLPSALTRWAALLTRLTDKTWFSYTLLFLLQLKVVWGMWAFRDLTPGDTSGYFGRALDWYALQGNSFAWSPLYTAFYGSLLHLIPDAYAVTILHRLIIVFVALFLVLMLMRQLLPASIALLVSAWWAVMPVNFDTLYEVHLFSIIPTLIAFNIAARKPSLWTRGVVLAVFVVSAFLVRNELLIATALWGIICLVTEIRARRSQPAAPVNYILGYGIPLAIALAVVGFFFVRSTTQGKVLQEELRIKHTLNVCQIVTYSYMARYTDWQGSPWTQCQDLMQQKFGLPEPSMLEAIVRNPRLMFEYFVYNVRLMPAGLQKLLFSSTTDRVNPDYAPTKIYSVEAAILTLGYVLVLYIGGRRLRQERHEWWDSWLRERRFGWLALLCAAATVVFVMEMQRPRPSYMFNLSFLLLAAFGVCLYAIISRTHRLEWLATFPVLVIAGILFIPSYYTNGYDTGLEGQQRIIMQAYQRLKPFAALTPNKVLAMHRSADDLCRYLARNPCTGRDYAGTASDKPPDVALPDWLDRKGINLFYIDETRIDDPLLQDFVQMRDLGKWQVVVNYQGPDGRWMLLRRLPD